MKVVVLCVVVVVIGVCIGIASNNRRTLVEQYPPQQQWWGEGPPKEDTKIHNFTIEASGDGLKDLSVRLKNTRYFDGIVEEDNKWKRGTYPDFMKELVDYWLNEYNWPAQVDYLNSYPNYKTNIDGLDIHFVHVKAKRSKNTNTMPILLLHGWPGSFLEFYGALPYLTDPSKSGIDFAFDVVLPSLPGYGFSQATRKKGFNAVAISLIFGKLMARLGYSSYVVQGGDYGSFFGRILPLYDKNCVGAHLNMYSVSTPWYAAFQLPLAYLLGPNTIFSEHDHKKFFPGRAVELLTETGYMHLQATRPYSVGHALTDSPVGLAAYIIEKFYAWADIKDGDIYSTFTKDQLLTNVMIYWVNNAIASSLNYYYEIVGDVKFVDHMTKERIHTPVALADLNVEMIGANPPLSWASSSFKNIVQYTEFSKGGHFAVFEQPEALSKDILTFGKFMYSNNKNNTN